MNSINLEEYAGSNEFPLAETGDYEVVLKITKKSRTNKEGVTRDYLNLDFFIRDDVNQPCQGVHVFDKAWREATNAQWYDLKKLGNILITQKGRPDYRTNFEESDEFVQYINGAHLRVGVVKKIDDYSGKEINEIRYRSYKPSNFGPYVKPTKAEQETAASPDNQPATAPVANPDPAAAVGIEPPLQEVPSAEVEISPDLKDKVPF